jgi:hypothetical protein
MLRNNGDMKPTARPYGHPQMKPQSSTGRCIGRSMFPNCGICPVKNGSRRHSARNNPEYAKFLTDDFFMIFHLAIIRRHEDTLLVEQNTFVASFVRYETILI